MFDQVQSLLDEHADLERQLADPAVHADAAKARQAGPTICRAWGQQSLPTASGSVLDEDVRRRKRTRGRRCVFTEEAERLSSERDAVAERLRLLWCHAILMMTRTSFLRSRLGEGGDESALFAGDLLRMYLRYAERQGWKTEILDAQESDLGGYKDVSVAVKSRGNPAPGDGVWAS